MNKFLLIIICIYLLLTPFYIFSSGVPQPADLLIALGGGLFCFTKEFKKIFNLLIFKKINRLLLLIITINLCYWFYLNAIEGIDNKIYFSSIYYIFNILAAIMFVFVQTSFKKNIGVNTIAIFIILSLLIQFLLAILGIQGGNKDAESMGRPSIFFNNPNQLGYYALSMITLFFILNNKYKKNIFILLFTIFIASYLIFYSGSRAALAGVLMLSAYVIYKEGFKLNFQSIILILSIIISLPFLFQTEFIQKRLDLIESRNERNSDSGASQAEIRGYDRIYLNPQYIFYGAGEGKNDRFKSRHQLEIHSGFGTMLFSYGILGLCLFMNIIYSSVKRNLIHSTLLLLPIIIYNITHNGLRSALFWVIIATIFIMNDKTKVNKI